MDKPTFFITDVFTDRKYGGNPLATFVDCDSFSAQEMQQIAKEINFSETTFITSRQPKEGGFDVRIFTPKSEVDFAGHPTLGTAFVIREKLRLTSAREVVLNLRIGKIPVTFSDTVTLSMKQMPPQFGKSFDPGVLARMLSVATADIDDRLPIEEASTGFPTLIVPLKNLAALQRARIDSEAYFSFVKDNWAKLILVYSRDVYASDHALSVRVFADFYGIREDAATGSSNGALAAYLMRHQVFGADNLDVIAGQGYEIGRPSTLALRATRVQGNVEVFIGGSVVAVAEGVWG